MGTSLEPLARQLRKCPVTARVQRSRGGRPGGLTAPGHGVVSSLVTHEGPPSGAKASPTGADDADANELRTAKHFFIGEPLSSDKLEG